MGSLTGAGGPFLLGLSPPVDPSVMEAETLSEQLPPSSRWRWCAGTVDETVHCSSDPARQSL